MGKLGLFRPQRSPKHKPDQSSITAPQSPSGVDFKPQKIITLHPESTLAKQFQAAQAKMTGGLH